MSQKEEEDDLDAFFDQVEEAAREAAVASEELPLLDHGDGNVDVDDRNNHLEQQQQKQQEEYHKDNGKVVKEVKEEEPIAVQGTKTAITTGTGQQDDDDDDDETGIEVRRPAKRFRVDHHHHHEEPNEQDPERNATSAATTAANGGTVVVSKKATATISVPPIHHHHHHPYHPSRRVEEKEEKKDIYHITVPEHALPPPPPPPAPPQPPMPMHASQSYPPPTQQQQQQQQQPNMPLDISQEGNVKPALRIAAGKTWVDPNLSQFPENDYRLFVGNLDKVITEQKLSEAFQSKYPSFVMCRIVYDKITGLSKGYGFVSLMDPKDCARAIREMDQSWLGSRPIKVKRSDWKERDLKLVQKQNKKKKKHK